MKEKLTKEGYYLRIFTSINNLIDSGENADDIFDVIVDHFAYEAEKAKQSQDTYTALLNKVRNNNPVESISDVEDHSDYIEQYKHRLNNLVSSLNDSKKGIMLENQNKLKDFVEGYQFPNED